MDNTLLIKVLMMQAREGRVVELRVTGISMNPALNEGDILTVQFQSDYAVGDILVFLYKEGELLVHRLLRMEAGWYYCKGDNAFRLEDVTAEQIVGKVIAVNGREPPPCSQRLLTLSYLVNRAFLKCRYDVERTKRTPIYQLYAKTILRNEETMMIYRKNEEMQYIQADEGSLAVFDPESGDTHFFDETGIHILNCLSEPCELDGLLDKLCGIFDATPEDIRADVEEFLRETVEKKVVLTL